MYLTGGLTLVFFAFVTAVFRPFPRGQLLYVKEIGLGWFGQVSCYSQYFISVQEHLNLRPCLPHFQAYGSGPICTKHQG